MDGVVENPVSRGVDPFLWNQQDFGENYSYIISAKHVWDFHCLLHARWSKLCDIGIRWAFPFKVFLLAGSSWTSYVNTMFHSWLFNRVFTLVARLFQEMPVSKFLSKYPNSESTIDQLQVGGYLRLVHFMLFFWALHFFSIKPHGCEWESFTRMQNAAIFTLLYPDYFSISYCLVFLTFNRCYGLFYHYYFFGVVLK